MPNWFERNATKGIIIYTILIMGSTFAFYKFTFEERKLDNCKSQIVSVQTEIEQHKSRIDYLERENLQLKYIVREFEQWNKESNNPALFYKNQYEKMLLQQADINFDEENDEERIRVFKSTVYNNKKKQLIVGLKEVNVDRTCNLNISFKNNENNVYGMVEVGEVITITSEESEIKILIEEIDYYQSFIVISIK